MKWCYPIHKRGEQIVWSGSAFCGPDNLREEVELQAGYAAQRALKYGTPSSRKTDEPGTIWLEHDGDVLTNNNATKVTKASPKEVTP